jgi:hypothetical protein
LGLSFVALGTFALLGAALDHRHQLQRIQRNDLGYRSRRSPGPGSGLHSQWTRGDRVYRYFSRAFSDLSGRGAELGLASSRPVGSA